MTLPVTADNHAPRAFPQGTDGEERRGRQLRRCQKGPGVLGWRRLSDTTALPAGGKAPTGDPATVTLCLGSYSSM